MKKVLWLAMAVLFAGAITLSSCKAAGGDSTKSDKKADTKKTDKKGSKKVSAGEVTFKFIPADGDEPESVYLASDFNGWNPSDPNYMLEEEDGEFVIEVELDPGTYKFKYVIDGEWVQSMEDLGDQVQPTPTEYVDDGFGGKNAVLEIEE